MRELGLDRRAHLDQHREVGELGLGALHHSHRLLGISEGEPGLRQTPPGQAQAGVAGHNGLVLLQGALEIPGFLQHLGVIGAHHEVPGVERQRPAEGLDRRAVLPLTALEVGQVLPGLGQGRSALEACAVRRARLVGTAQVVERQPQAVVGVGTVWIELDRPPQRALGPGVVVAVDERVAEVVVGGPVRRVELDGSRQELGGRRRIQLDQAAAGHERRAEAPRPEGHQRGRGRAGGLGIAAVLRRLRALDVVEHSRSGRAQHGFLHAGESPTRKRRSLRGGALH